MAKHIENGVVYTPDALADLTANVLFRTAHNARYVDRNEPVSIDKVWDPCCGQGALLRACRRAVPGIRCCGIDVDREALAVPYADDMAVGVADLFDYEPGSSPLLVCNPPYVGRSNLSRIVGKDRFDWLKKTYKVERGGSCDLAGYVLRHILERWRPAVSTWIVTNTIAQGSTRRVGLRWATANGYKIVSALKDIQWPGQAAVTVHVVTLVDTQAVAWDSDVEYVPKYKQ